MFPALTNGPVAADVADVNTCPGVYELCHQASNAQAAMCTPIASQNNVTTIL